MHYVHKSFVVELGENRAHAVVTQTARVRSGRNKSAAKRVHFCKRANATGVAVVVNVLAAREGRTAFGLNGNKLIIRLTAQLFTHKGSDQTAQVRATTGTTDDDVCLYTVFVKRGFGLHTNNRLMQHNLRKNTTKNVTIAFAVGSSLNRLGDGATKASRSAGELFKDLSAYARGVRR